MSWSRPVFSSMCQEIGFDEAFPGLTVLWAKGTRGVYLEVPEAVALDCSLAPSVGNFINSEIKPNYEYRKL